MQLGIVDGEPIGSKLSPVQGFTPVGAPASAGWVTAPSGVSAVAASVTVTSAATLDWSRYGVFQYLCTNGSAALALTFSNATVGQRIGIVIKQASTSTATTVTLPTGAIVAGTTAATQALTNTNSVVDIIHVTCTAPGVYIASFN
jgi:hypothetical protein